MLSTHSGEPRLNDLDLGHGSFQHASFQVVAHSALDEVQAIGGQVRLVRLGLRCVVVRAQLGYQLRCVLRGDSACTP